MTFTDTGTQNPHQIIVRKKILKNAVLRRASYQAATIAGYRLFADGSAVFIDCMIEVTRPGPSEGFFLPTGPKGRGNFGGGAK